MDGVNIEQVIPAQTALNKEPPRNTLPLRHLAPGEVFEGDMPIILDWGTAELIRAKARELYGEEIGHGKFGTVYGTETDATKVFHDPGRFTATCEAIFAKRFSGKAGLPRFIGVVPNGYKMERIIGRTLNDLIQGVYNAQNPNRYGSIEVDFKNMLTPAQGQQILDRVAEFHRETGRVHGDLGKPQNIFLTAEGVRFIDPEWERVDGLTPQQELDGMYEYLTSAIGLQDLKKPETISTEDAERNLDDFRQEVHNMLEKDQVGKILRFKECKVSITSNSHDILVKEI